MKKALLFFAVLTVGISCRRTDERAQALTSGQINHISVIIDALGWNGDVGDTLRTKFASPVTGLPQEEPLFTINQYPLKLLEGFTTNTRNILVVKTGERKFEITSSKRGAPQNIIHISGRNIPELLEMIEQKSQQLVEIMKATELQEAQNRMDSALIDVAPIKREFGITLAVPSSYQIVLEGKKFIWLKREIISGNASLIIYELPLSALNTGNDLINRITHIRDSIGAEYIHGTVPDSPMVTEGAYAPYLREVKIAGMKAYEAKGTWELRNDFMSGPFINFTIPDVRRGRILVLEGFCYAPSKEKRDLMHELEAIIKTIKFN